MNLYMFKDNSDIKDSYLGARINVLFSEKLKSQLHLSGETAVYKAVSCEGLLWDSKDDLVDTKVLWINESKVIECYYNCLLFINSNSVFFKAFENLHLNKFQEEDIELIKIYVEHTPLSSLIKKIVPNEYNNIINYFVSHSDEEIKDFILNYSTKSNLKENIILNFLECLLLKRLGCNFGINLANEPRFKSTAKDYAEECIEMQYRIKKNDQIRSSSAIAAEKSYTL